ncbi:MAG: hypothetical protein EZS28_000182 [Streblomastix strix]|uniref:Uncharacterized protein n=1 Tax=Streblomastix strix TaxID=222440 RepID=A0A5J4XBU7_9EUKA|nr:MAG: hypothetical protein EZS28_000182 [Streblomastix strix]
MHENIEKIKAIKYIKNKECNSAFNESLRSIVGYCHKQFEDDPMQIDLVQNRVVGPNTSIRETKNNVRETLKYETINDWANMTHLTNLRDMLESWNVDIEIPKAEFEKLKIIRIFGQQITNDGTIDKMDDEFAQVRLDGLKNLTIHNYPQPISMEVSLLCVFSGIYGIVSEQIRAQVLENVRQFNTLTANAEKNKYLSLINEN